MVHLVDKNLIIFIKIFFFYKNQILLSDFLIYKIDVINKNR